MEPHGGQVTQDTQDKNPQGDQVVVIGGGLAGCECAWQLAERGIAVRLIEMRPHRRSPAHQTDGLGELVCSNSFRSDAPENAVGLLHEELRRAGSLMLRLADVHRVPAGDALAVDREKFSADVEAHIRSHARIRVVHGEVEQLPLDEGLPMVVATGPLTSDTLAADIARLTGQARLSFFDAIAPILDAPSIDEEKVFRASRWGKGDGDDYVNCPMDKVQYLAFIDALLQAETSVSEEFEKDAHYFPGCLPIEVIAASGPKSLRFGPMKPTGLDDPRTGRWAYAIVQLRAENRDKTAYNMVGFQTKMKQGEQRRVLRMIPGLEQVEFLRYGSVHRNTFLDSPKLLDEAMCLKSAPHLRFAGQITGVEGYLESTASGLWVGARLAADLRGTELQPPPPTTSLGALLRHVREGSPSGFQPSNVHFGLFPALDPAVVGRKPNKADRKAGMRDRARLDLPEWLQCIGVSVEPASGVPAVDACG
jgi:methylenetetrahydrofolate--tRNA-(uracil-5-)-methyltransferase